MRGRALSSATACLLSGTTCSLPAFMRSAGTVQSACVEIDLAPRRAANLAAPGCRQDQQLKRPGRHAVTLAQARHEGRNLGERHGRVVAALGRGEDVLKVTLPSGLGFAVAEPVHPRPVEHLLDPATDARAGLRCLVPDRRQELDDHRRVDLGRR